MPSPHRAVFFDAGNTLLRMNYDVIAAELARHGVQTSGSALEAAEWRARVRLDDELLSRRAPGLSTESGSTASHYLRLMLEGVGVTDDAVVHALGEWRRRYNLPVGVWNTATPRAGAACQRARSGGLTVGVVSNSNGSVRSALAALGLDQFDFVLDSAEVGVEKPDPRIFQLALERAGVGPAEAVYVGDLYSIDILGARAAGLGAILLDPGGCWGPRDCATAIDALAAVELILAGGVSTRATVR